MVKYTSDLEILQQHPLFHDVDRINTLIHHHREVAHDILGNAKYQIGTNVIEKEYIKLCSFYQYDEYESIAKWRCKGIGCAILHTAYLTLISPILCICCPFVFAHEFVNTIENEDYQEHYSICAPYYVCNIRNKEKDYPYYMCYPCCPIPKFCVCTKIR